MARLLDDREPTSGSPGILYHAFNYRRRLPRYEDPVLLRGDGSYVADMARGSYVADMARGALAMRFVRSPVARGKIRGITTPPGARVVTAADLTEVKPLCPRLLRPDFAVETFSCHSPSNTVPGAAISAKAGVLSSSRFTAPRGLCFHASSNLLPRDSSVDVRSR